VSGVSPAPCPARFEDEGDGEKEAEERRDHQVHHRVEGRAVPGRVAPQLPRVPSVRARGKDARGDEIDGAEREKGLRNPTGPGMHQGLQRPVECAAALIGSIFRIEERCRAIRHAARWRLPRVLEGGGPKCGEWGGGRGVGGLGFGRDVARGRQPRTAREEGCGVGVRALRWGVC